MMTMIITILSQSYLLDVKFKDFSMTFQDLYKQIQNLLYQIKLKYLIIHFSKISSKHTYYINQLYYSPLLNGFNPDNEKEPMAAKSSSSSSNFWSGFLPINGGGRIYPTLTAIFPTPTLHLARFKASSFSKPTLLLSFSTCIFTSSLVILASSCPTVQTSTLFSKYAHHPSSTHACTISLHLEYLLLEKIKPCKVISSIDSTNMLASS